MPIVKNLSKLQKKKADTKLHPNGRKFKQLNSAEHRHNKLTTLKSLRNNAQERKLQKHKFLKHLVSSIDKPEFTVDEMRIMCQQFIDRNLPELEQLNNDRRPGRPPTSYHQQLKLVYDMENEEFRSGFNIIDVSDKQTVKNLKEWNGSWGGLNMLKMTRVSKQ